MTLKEINQPELIDLLNSMKQDILKDINCIRIGIIQGFDATNQTATIEIASKQIASIDTKNNRTLKDFPILLECPVMVLSGGNSRITFPIEIGDTCIILFNDREIDNWFVDGNIQAPSTLRKHDLSDGLAIVGIRNLQNAIGDYSITDTDWRYNATSKITQNNTTTTIANTNINLNGAVTATSLSTTGVLSAGNGWTGTFATGDSRTVTVTNGIIVSVS